MDENDVINVELPADLSTLSDGDLDVQRANAKAAFTSINEKAELSAEDEATLETLVEAKLALDAEKARRATLATEKVAKRAAAAAAFADAPEDDEDEDDAEEAPAAPAEVEASAAPKKISVQALKARQPKVDLTPVAKNTKVFTAGQGAKGYGLGAKLDEEEVAKAIMAAADPSHVRMSIESAMRKGQRHVSATEIASFAVDYGPELIVTDALEEFTPSHSAYKFATDQSRLTGGSLTAAGGWCAPSETIYDLCELESRDGLISLPEVRVNRGGIRFTQGPDWADIFTSSGFCFTEAEDIAGTYGVNEIQTATEGGSGLTSFTLTYNGPGASGTTVLIPVDSSAAVVASALQALPAIGPENVNVSASGAAGAVVYTITFVNALGNVNITALTSTPTGGSGTVTIATVQQGGGSAGTKPCATVPCPPFTDVRLNVCGICVNAGILMNSAYPELVRRYVSGALTGHVHRLNTNVIASLVSQSTNVTVLSQPSPNQSAAGALLGAIELEAEDIRYRRRMSRNSVLEVVLPFWVRGALRKDFASRNTSANPYEVADADIARWFALRGVNVQYVYDWQNLGSGNAATAWPTTVNFLIYPAGTFVRGTSGLVTLNNLYDSTLYSNNNFTAIFTEEAWSVMKMCPESRNVTVPLCYNGGAVSLAGPAVICAAA